MAILRSDSAARDPGGTVGREPTADLDQTTRTTHHTGVFSVTARLHGDILALHIAGELDMATVPYVEETIDPYRGAFGRVALMLEDLDFVDGFGITHVLDLFDGATTVILNPSPSIRRVLGILDIPVTDVTDIEGLDPGTEWARPDV